jgi:hypothetical protein
LVSLGNRTHYLALRGCAMARPKGSKTNPHRKPILKRAEIRRTVEAVKDMGLTPYRVDAYHEQRKVSVITAPTGDAAVTVDFNEANPWDKVLKKDAED